MKIETATQRLAGILILAAAAGAQPSAKFASVNGLRLHYLEWGTPGNGPSQFRLVHAVTVDANNRVLVSDRSNNRIQIFDQNGNFIAQWFQFGRPSGIFIDRDDTIYVTNATSVELMRTLQPIAMTLSTIRAGMSTSSALSTFVAGP